MAEIIEKVDLTIDEIINDNHILDKPHLKSIRIVVEKLENGYVSNADGKRKVYSETKEIVKAIGFNAILDGIAENEYKINIDLISKEKYDEYDDALTICKQVREEKQMSYEEAKEKGIIETDKFNPTKKETLQPEEEIKITETNAYSSMRLKSIDWESLHKELYLSNSEKAKICGIDGGSMYGLWKMAIKKKATYQRIKSRIAMTILAKYYENNLEIRTSSIDKQAFIEEQVLGKLREMELLTSGNNFVKSSELAKKISDIRKLFIK